MARNKLSLKGAQDAFRKMKPQILEMASQEAINHFQDNFRKRGFVDQGVQPWKEVQRRIAGTLAYETTGSTTRGRGILIGKGSGHLRRMIRRVRRGTSYVVVGVKGIPYAEIHNEGGTIRQTLTEKQRRYFRYIGAKSNNPVVRKQAFGMSQGSTITINIPRRKYIGNSRKLEKKVEKMINNQIKKIWAQS